MAPPLSLALLLAGVLLSASPARASIGFTWYGGVAINPGDAAIAVADLNRDGRSDVVVVSDTVSDMMSDTVSEVQVFLAAQNDDVRLELRATYQVGEALRQLAIGDLNADGIPDVVCTERLTPGVWILLGQGSGTLLEPYKIDVGRSPQAVAIADVDGRDGNDVVVSDSRLGSAFILLNNGGTPPAFSEPIEVEVGAGPDELLAIDVNRDGRPDLVTLNNGAPRGREVAIRRFTGLQDGVPQFEAIPQRIPVDRPSHLLAAELNGSAAPDLALIDQSAGRASGEIALLLNDGSGGFTPNTLPVPCPFFTGGSPCRLLGLAAADVNRDNRTDLAVALDDPRHREDSQSERDVVQVLAGYGDGRFAFGPAFAILKNPTAIAVASTMNRDCLPDLLITSRRSATLDILLNVSGPASGRPANGASCLNPDECLSGRCTDARCCATTCERGERCNLPAHEGICTPAQAPIVQCTGEADCTGTALPFCVDGFCCEDACAGGHCNVPGFEGLCIPGVPAGGDCTHDEECTSGFCSDNCCLESCEGGFCDEVGVCHPLIELGGLCAVDDECRSRVCDEFVGICCNRRCDEFEFCDETGHCSFSGAEAAPLSLAPRRQPVAAPLEVRPCPADCDGDAAVSIAEVIRLINAALGTGVATPCPAADTTAPLCVAIGDIVAAVAHALNGCP